MSSDLLFSIYLYMAILKIYQNFKKILYVTFVENKDQFNDVGN